MSLACLSLMYIVYFGYGCRLFIIANSTLLWSIWVHVCISNESVVHFSVHNIIVVFGVAVAMQSKIDIK